MALESDYPIGIKNIATLSNTRSIQFEIEGEVLTDYSLQDCWDNSDAEFKYGESLPKSLSDWLSYEHTPYGQCGGISDGTREGYIKRVTQGSTYYIEDTELVPPNYEFVANQDEDVRVDIDNGGTAFVVGDKCIAMLYRRERGDAGAWTNVQSWVPPVYYLSQAYSCDFETYNYYWLLAQGV